MQTTHPLGLQPQQALLLYHFYITGHTFCLQLGCIVILSLNNSLSKNYVPNLGAGKSCIGSASLFGVWAVPATGWPIALLQGPHPSGW